MDKKAKTYQLIKGDIKSKIQDLNKIIMSKEISSDELNEERLKEKMSKIQEKLSCSNNPTRGIHEFERVSFLKKNTSNLSKTVKFFDTGVEEDFRHFNIFLPKIKISQNTQVRSTFSQQTTNFIEKIKQSSENLTSSNNSIKDNEFKFKKLNKLNTFKKDFTFYENKYFEFTYNEVPDKMFGFKKLTDNKVFLAFKKMFDDKAHQEYQLSEKSSILKFYDNLLKLEEMNKLSEMEENRVREDELIYDPKEHEEEKKKEVTHHSKSRPAQIKETAHNQNSLLPDNKYNETANLYKNWFLKENEKLLKVQRTSNDYPIEYSNDKDSMRPKPINTNKKSDKNQEESDHLIPKDASVISFGIELQILIDKAIRQSNKYHTRILHIEGPVVSWFRYKENQTKNIKKGTFDLRKSIIAKFVPQINLNSMDNKNEIRREECHVTFKIKNKNKEDEDKIVKFVNEPIKAFKNKSIKDIFEQIKRYYNLILYFFKQNKIDFQKLRFISDPKITSLYLSREDCNTDLLKSLIDNIDWHTRLTKVHLKGVDKTSIIKFFGVLKNSDILLEDIKIESIMNYNTLEFEGTSNMLGPIKEYFSKPCCKNLVEFHLIDVKIPDLTLILNILRSKFKQLKKDELIIEQKLGGVQFSMGPNNNYLQEEEVKKNRSNSVNSLARLSYKRLSFKKVSNSNAIINIDLNELYKFFMEMIAEEGRIEKFENVFECLDIAGADCTNLEGMKNIINHFKIIKHLNLSGTKIISGKNTHNQRDKGYNHSNDKSSNIYLNDFLINNLDFLRSVNTKDSRDLATENPFKKSELIEDNTTSTIPLLSTLTLHDTPLSTDASIELLQWFKRFRFLKEINISEFNSTLSSSANSESVKFLSLITDVKKEDDNFCENFFEIEYSDKLII